MDSERSGSWRRGRGQSMVKGNGTGKVVARIVAQLVGYALGNGQKKSPRWAGSTGLAWLGRVYLSNSPASHASQNCSMYPGKSSRSFDAL